MNPLQRAKAPLRPSRLRQAFRRSRTLLLVVLFVGVGSLLSAKNPLSTYFSRLLDESRAEVEVGRMLLENFQIETGGASRTTSLPEIDAIVDRLAVKAPRSAVRYQVMILDSSVPGEIAFPGGPIIITQGMLALASTPQERIFLVARNIMHVALRNPMTVIKKEGLYGPLLKVLKIPPARRDREAVRQILRGYLKAATGMDQKKADREGVRMFDDQQEGRAAALAFLRKMEREVWPVMPWEWFDLPSRIQNLENLSP